MIKIQKTLIITIGVVVVSIAFYISVSAGFAFVIGLCCGSLIEKFGWNE